VAAEVHESLKRFHQKTVGAYGAILRAMNEPVVVYEFEIYDAASRRWKRSLRRGTLAAIHACNGVPIRSSALVVDPARVDADGFVEASRTIKG
jgi:hypothetical protein